jgi:hypothetical protein
MECCSSRSRWMPLAPADRDSREPGHTWPACMCHASVSSGMKSIRLSERRALLGRAQPGRYGCTCSVRHEWPRSAGSGTQFGPIPRATGVVGRLLAGIFKCATTAGSMPGVAKPGRIPCRIGVQDSCSSQKFQSPPARSKQQRALWASRM